MSAIAVAFVVLVLPLKPVEGNIAKKLAVVDYFGTALTLVGCSLVILPLIWVSESCVIEGGFGALTTSSIHYREV